MLIYRVTEHFPKQAIFAGAPLGRQHIAPFLKTLAKSPGFDEPAQIVVLDLSGIDFVSASYVRSLVLPVWKLAGVPIDEEVDLGELEGQTRNIFPLLAGLSEDVKEGIQDMLATRAMLCLEAVDWSSAPIEKARLWGRKSGVVLDTLKALLDEGQGTATSLHESNKLGINVTGWNNRLADLHQLRLARRTRQGKTWLYEPVVSSVEVVYG